MNDRVNLWAADAEIQEIYGWLEDHRGEGSGDRFLHHLHAATERLRRFPELGPVYHGNFRRLLVRHTPYGVFYSVTGQRVFIAHVLDLRQDPATILRLLGE